MKEVKPDQQFPEVVYDLAGLDYEALTKSVEALSTKMDALRESNLAVVSLLMRLYDVEMAALSNTYKEDADALFDLHSNGGTQNPPVFIPNVTHEGE